MKKPVISQKVAIIGGTSGIGLVTARDLIAKGYDVVVGSRNEDHVTKALKALDGKAQGLVVDASDPESLSEFFGLVARVDHVVITPSNRGGVKPLADITKADIEAGVHGKLLPQIFSVQAAHKAVSEAGSITLISAITAMTPIPGTTLLAAMNGAIASIVPTLAAELKPVRVNAVLPGTIDTEWWSWLPGDARKSVFADTAKNTPVGRIGRPEDVADAIAFLIGNDYINGMLLPCDGGAHIK